MCCALNAIQQLELLFFGDVQLHALDWIFAWIVDVLLIQVGDVDGESPHDVLEFRKCDWTIAIFGVPNELRK